MKKKYIIIVIAVVAIIAMMQSCLGRDAYDSNSNETDGGYDLGYEGLESESAGETAEEELENEISAEELFMEGLQDSVTEDEYLTPASELSNAILYALQIDILEDKGNRCRVRITYPEVGEELIKLENELPDDANEEEIYEVYRVLTEMVKKENITMKEVTCTLAIGVDEYGESYIDWTDEAMKAMTGGLYGIE